MKKLLVLFVSLFFTSFIYAQKTSELIVIYHTTGHGDRYSNVWFSTDKKNLKISNAPLTKENPPDIYNHKYVISRKSFLRIKQFMLDNCNTNNTINDSSDDYFVIKIDSGKSKISCFLENKMVSKPYIEKLLKYINVTPYKEELKEFIADYKGMLQWYDYVPPQVKYK